MKQYLLFDLDGTLTDPKIGITTCAQYALESFGIHEPDLDKLEPFIGPPLKDSFMQFYGMSSEQAEQAIVKYRERFSTIGLYENEIYKGIPKLLKTLKSKGFHLAVASSKPTDFVIKILEHFNIACYFEVIVGSELDGSRVNKDEVIQEALNRLFRGFPVARERIYMIGDRKFDSEGARKMGIESIGVTYGYGGMEELMEAHTDYIVRSVEELQEFLLREQEYDKPRMEPMARVWQMLYLFVLFLIVRSITLYVCSFAIQAVSAFLPDAMLNRIYQPRNIIYDSGELVFTPDAWTLITMVSYLAGTLAISSKARMMITRTAKDERLIHLFIEPVRNYVLMGMVAIGMYLGVTMLLTLTGLTGSESYQQVAGNQFSAGLFWSILCYGIVTPLAEECMFRGVLYNAMKRFMSRKIAWILSAFLFGAYHGNIVQGIFGFVMGLVLAYGYEYFGSFKVPVILHMAANVIALLLSAIAGGGSAWISWPLCIAMLAFGGMALILMVRQKKTMRW